MRWLVVIELGLSDALGRIKTKILDFKVTACENVEQRVKILVLRSNWLPKETKTVIVQSHI